MELRTHTDQVDDPCFAAVRRRHPDVDIVLLPPTDLRRDAAADAVSADDVEATLARVATQLDRLWSAVAPQAREQPEARFRYGASASSVRAVARVVARTDDGSELLVRLRRVLDVHGWAPRRPRGAGLLRLSGSRDDLDLIASWAPESGALLLTIASGSMPVGAERADELTTGRL